MTVQCPIVGCNGLQPLKISIEKLPPILVLEIAATVDGRDETLLSCIEDIESKLTIQGTLYALVQVILHNGSHYRGVTVLNNQNASMMESFVMNSGLLVELITFHRREWTRVIGCLACGTERF